MIPTYKVHSTLNCELELPCKNKKKHKYSVNIRKLYCKWWVTI